MPNYQTLLTQYAQARRDYREIDDLESRDALRRVGLELAILRCDPEHRVVLNALTEAGSQPERKAA